MVCDKASAERGIVCCCDGRDPKSLPMGMMSCTEYIKKLLNKDGWPDSLPEKMNVSQYVNIDSDVEMVSLLAICRALEKVKLDKLAVKRILGYVESRYLRNEK